MSTREPRRERDIVGGWMIEANKDDWIKVSIQKRLKISLGQNPIRILAQRQQPTARSLSPRHCQAGPALNLSTITDGRARPSATSLSLRAHPSAPPPTSSGPAASSPDPVRPNAADRAPSLLPSSEHRAVDQAASRPGPSPPSRSRSAYAAPLLPLFPQLSQHPPKSRPPLTVARAPGSSSLLLYAPYKRESLAPASTPPPPLPSSSPLPRCSASSHHRRPRALDLSRWTTSAASAGPYEFAESRRAFPTLLWHPSAPAVPSSRRATVCHHHRPPRSDTSLSRAFSEDDGTTVDSAVASSTPSAACRRPRAAGAPSAAVPAFCWRPWSSSSSQPSIDRSTAKIKY